MGDKLMRAKIAGGENKLATDITKILFKALKAEMNRHDDFTDMVKLQLSIEILVNTLGNIIYSALDDNAPIEVFEDFEELTKEMLGLWFEHAKVKFKIKGKTND